MCVHSSSRYRFRGNCFTIIRVAVRTRDDESREKTAVFFGTREPSQGHAGPNCPRKIKNKNNRNPLQRTLITPRPPVITGLFIVQTLKEKFFFSALPAGVRPAKTGAVALGEENVNLFHF